MFTGGAQSNYLIPVKKSALADWSSQSEHLRDHYNAELDELLNIYEMVANFIKRKKRILVGGMAIDYALRLVGSKLYKVEKIDYDFISPDYHNDAYELGNEVAKKYSDVSVICAKHISTMRVRYKFIAVADITYVPKILFDKIQTLPYEGFSIIHPWVQQIDQLRAMRNMLEGAPREMILSNRIEKDTKRYRLLANAYPIDLDKYDKNIIKSPIDSKVVEINIEYDKVLTGFPAAIYWLDKLNIEILNWSITCEKEHIRIVMPSNEIVSYIIDADIETIVKTIEKDETVNNIKHFHRLLDKLYPSIQFTKSEKKSDTEKGTGTEKKSSTTSVAKSEKKAVTKSAKTSEKKAIAKSEKKAEKKSSTKSAATTGTTIEYFEGYGEKHIVYVLDTIDDKPIFIDSFYGTMVWLSTRWLLNGNETAGYIYGLLQKKFIENPIIFVPDFKYIFGSSNISSTQMLAKKKRDDPASFKLLLPKNSYLQKGESNNYPFDLTKSELLQIDGQEIKPTK